MCTGLRVGMVTVTAAHGIDCVHAKEVGKTGYQECKVDGSGWRAKGQNPCAGVQPSIF